MSYWPLTPNLDYVSLNRFERDVKVLAGECHDVGYDDLPELRLKLHGIVSLCSELLALAERHESARLSMIDREIGREEREASIPPLGT